MIRKFKRNVLRKRVGNRNLKSAWERYQRNRYKEHYTEICKPKITY